MVGRHDRYAEAAEGCKFGSLSINLLLPPDRRDMLKKARIMDKPQAIMSARAENHWQK